MRAPDTQATLEDFARQILSVIDDIEKEEGESE